MINNIYSYKKLDRTTNEDGTRFYICPETNSPVPSVTTILSATGDKTFLKEWQEWVGEKKAEAIRTEATNLGSLMHEHLEKHILGEDRPRGNNMIRMMAARMADAIIDKGLSDVGEVYGTEVALYHPGLYAGTTDLVGLYKGRPAIMDFKTAKKMRTRDMIEDYFGQLAAYREAHNFVHGTDIKVGVVFMVDRELRYQSFVIEDEEMDHHAVRFMERLERYYEKTMAA